MAMKIPEGYRKCEIFSRGGETRVYPLNDEDVLVMCTATCPYGSRTKATMKFEDDTIERPICDTRGLVKLAELGQAS